MLLSGSGRTQKLHRKTPRSPVPSSASGQLTDDVEEEIEVASPEQIPRNAVEVDNSDDDDEDMDWTPVDDFEEAHSCLPALEGNLTEEQVIKYRFTMTEPGKFIIFVHNLN